MLFICWENRVLQLVSEQVGPSGQVVESLVSCDGLILSCFLIIISREVNIFEDENILSGGELLHPILLFIYYIEFNVFLYILFE